MKAFEWYGGSSRIHNKVQQQKYLNIYPFIVSYNEHVVYTDLYCRMFADLVSKDKMIYNFRKSHCNISWKLKATRKSN